MPRPQVICLWCITAIGVSPVVLVAPAIPSLADEMGLTTGQSGLVLALATLPGALVALATGELTRRIGVRKVIPVALLMFGIGGGTTAFAESFGLVLAARTLQGLSTATLLIIPIFVFFESFEGSERLKELGRNAMVMSISILVFPLLGGLLATVDWRVAFLPYLLALPLALVASQLLDGESSPTGGSGAMRDALGHISWATVAMMTAIAMGFFVLLYGAIYTVGPILGEDELGVGSATIGGMFALLAASSIPALSLAGRLAALPRSTVIGASFVGFAAGMTLLTMTNNIAMMAAAMVVWGLSQGFVLPRIQEYSGVVMPPEFRVIGVALWVALASIGQAVAPVLAGTLEHAAGLTATFVAGILIAAGCAVVSFASGAEGRLSKPT